MRRIYYDIASGMPILDTGYRSVEFEVSVDYEISTYSRLKERSRESFSIIEIPNDQYKQDFEECTSYRVNPKTQQLEFSYEPIEDGEQPIYQEPLSEQVARLQQENKLLKAQNNVLAERTDFHEEVLSEIILTITS